MMEQEQQNKSLASVNSNHLNKKLSPSAEKLLSKRKHSDREKDSCNKTPAKDDLILNCLADIKAEIISLREEQNLIQQEIEAQKSTQWAGTSQSVQKTGEREEEEIKEKYYETKGGGQEEEATPSKKLTTTHHLKNSHEKFKSQNSVHTFYLSNYFGTESELKQSLLVQGFNCLEFVNLSKDSHILHRLRFDRLIRPSSLLKQMPSLELSGKEFALLKLLEQNDDEDQLGEKYVRKTLEGMERYIKDHNPIGEQ